jgi:hypothetical protein
MSDDLVRRVEAACDEIAHGDEPVTFAAVAARSGLARTTLYRNESLRAIVEEHRLRSREGLTLSGIATDVAHLRQSLEAVAAKVRHHEEEIRQLRRATQRSKPTN